MSQDSRVVMYAEDGLLPDAFHVYRLPLTDAWHDEPGPRSLTVALAFETACVTAGSTTWPASLSSCWCRT